MKIQFYNTLTNSVDPFEPLEPGVVRMYSCGPTVYDYAHIGNFRSFLFADLLRRSLELTGLEVWHVMNITDVGHMTDDQVADGAGEDKMQVAAKRIKEDKKSGKVPDGSVENPDDPYQVAQYYTDAFLDDGCKLGMKVAYEYPDRILHATQQIPAMQEMIQKLLDRGHAYISESGTVYFSVESLPNYGSLSGNTLEHLLSGAGGRVAEENQAEKKHPADFMLWKPDSSHIMKWDSPWGEGYPGWHIECSVMAMKRLEREVIDIHTGGEDLIFPHHECEIAQSCGATGNDLFARFWMHARFLLVEGEKMSKSKGNFFTVRDVLDGSATGRPVHPAVLRYELIKSHYRSNMNFTVKGLNDSAGAVKRLMNFRKSLEEQTGGASAEVDLSHPVLKQFADALADDLNIAGALGVILPWAATQPDDPHEALGVLKQVNSVLSVAPINEGLATERQEAETAEEGELDISKLCKEVDAARAEKNWDVADSIKKQLQDAGYEVRNTPEGTIAEKTLV